MAKRTYYGIIGDQNPIEHWGGVVFRENGEDRVIYFQSYDEDMVSVFFTDLDPGYLDFVDWDDVGSSVEMDPGELQDYLKSKKPLVLASLFDVVAGHYGWGEFDYYPQEMTIDQAEKKYGRMVDAAHRAQSRRMAKKNPSRAGSAALGGLGGGLLLGPVGAAAGAYLGTKYKDEEAGKKGAKRRKAKKNPSKSKVGIQLKAKGYDKSPVYPWIPFSEVSGDGNYFDGDSNAWLYGTDSVLEQLAHGHAVYLTDPKSGQKGSQEVYYYDENDNEVFVDVDWEIVSLTRGVPRKKTQSMKARGKRVGQLARKAKKNPCSSKDRKRIMQKAVSGR